MSGKLGVRLKGHPAGLLMLLGLALSGCSTLSPLSSASALVAEGPGLPGVESARRSPGSASVSSDLSPAGALPLGVAMVPAATAATATSATLTTPASTSASTSATEATLSERASEGASEGATNPSASAPPAGGFVSPDPIAAPPIVAPPVVLSETDPTPRVEAAHRGANRPYLVAGRQYVPRIDLTEHRERGTASWYGHAFHGRATSSGERFDMHGLSAAHKTLPIPSYVRVTHVRNGRSVVVRVNDRGPFSSDRVIDLSLGAAQRLGITQSGTAEVELQLLAAPQGFSSAMLARRSGAPSAAQAEAAQKASLSTAKTRDTPRSTTATSIQITSADTTAVTSPAAGAALGMTGGGLGALRVVTVDGDGAAIDASDLTSGVQPLNAASSPSP